MNKFKKLMAAVAVAVISLTSVPTVQHAYADTYNIRLDGKTLNTSQPVVNVNNRILVPFRDIGDAMGAKIDWQPKTATVTMFRGNLYSSMQIGDDTMYYGTFMYDDDGQIIYLQEFYQIMDTEATIINNYTYIPVRAIAEALGAEVEWKEATNTAIITSYEVEDPITGSTNKGDDDDKKDDDKKTSSNYGDFSNTSYFRTISSETAKNRFEDANNYPFIFVLYDSSSSSAKNIVPDIMETAADVKTRIYGVDINDSSYNEKNMNFLWTLFDENKFENPTVYFVYSKKNIDESKAPSDMKALGDKISRFELQAEVDTEYGDFGDTTYFKTKSASNINNMYLNDEEFILVLYDSTEEESKLYVPVIKQAAANKKQIMYGLDIDRYNKFYDTVEFLDDYKNETDYLPLVFLVYEGKYNYDEFEQPTSVSTMEYYIEEFREMAENYGAYNDFTGKHYTNTAITNVNELVKDKRTFMLLIYDSSDYDTYDTVETIISAMTANNYRTKFDYYAVNEYSNKYTANKNKDYDSWFTDKFSNKTTRPILIFIQDGKIIDYSSSFNTTKRINNFLDEMYDKVK